MPNISSLFGFVFVKFGKLSENYYYSASNNDLLNKK